MKGYWLKVCDWVLLVITVFILGSSVQLELTASRGILPVWIHIVIGCLLFSSIIWHLYLHFGWKNWILRLRKLKSPVTRLLAIFGLITIISGLLSMFHWVYTNEHSPLGGIHGKIGFIFLIFAMGHTIKRIKFYKRKRGNNGRSV